MRPGNGSGFKKEGGGDQGSGTNLWFKAQSTCRPLTLLSSKAHKVNIQGMYFTPKAQLNFSLKTLSLSPAAGGMHFYAEGVTQLLF